MQVERRPGEALHWANCVNVRDLGGHPTADGRRTRFGAVVRADNLSRLTPDGLAALRGYGVRTVIDLRSPFELEIDPSPFRQPQPPPGVAYCNLPVVEQDTAIAEAVAAAPTSEAMYRAVVDGCVRELGAIMRAIAEAPDGPLLVHCHAGKDRTGLVAALLLHLVGVTPERIAEDYAASNDRLQPHYEEVLEGILDAEERAATAREFAADPALMLELLAYIERRYGGVEGYLGCAGLSAIQVEALRARLLD